MALLERDVIVRILTGKHSNLSSSRIEMRFKLFKSKVLPLEIVVLNTVFTKIDLRSVIELSVAYKRQYN